METKNNTVWVLKGNNVFAVFSTKEYAKEHKLSLIEQWRKSIIKDSIPSSLNNRKEIEAHANEYEEVIQIKDDHYTLTKHWESGGWEGSKEWWRYELMSNEEWKEYYQEFVSQFVIKEWSIIK
ncbi:MAG: hypothetical protein LBL13_08360 [Bacteroidales bacterium]|jgi:hypothetical protein|nr:hypothetical protein [Bacteroidales bacterium]